MRPNGKSRVELEREANLVRSRLLRTVEQLDRRGHDALDLRLQLRNHFRQVVIGAAALMLATVGAIALIVHGETVAAEKRRLERRLLFRGHWRRPPVEPRPERSFLGEVVRSIVLGVLTTSAMIPVRRFAAQMARPPEARRAP
jgi:hypothetical protein